MFRYRCRGSRLSRKLTLGLYPAVGLKDARGQALAAAAKVAAGSDPGAEKQQTVREVREAERETDVDRVERVARQFVERHAKPSTRSWLETELMLNREVVSRWKGRRLSQLTRAHVHEMLDEIVDRGAPVSASRSFAAFRKMCRWAVSRGIIDRSPCEGVTAPSPAATRDRVLADDEVRLVWRAAERIGLPFGPVVRLLLLTGARRNEIAGLRWAEIDLAGRRWLLPAARAKNNRACEIPLSAAAVEILSQLPRFGVGDFVFSTTGRTHVSGFSRAKTALDRAIVEMQEGAPPLAPWRFHDLRRTLATGLQRLGVRLEVTEAVLNHVSGSRAGITGIYQRYEWAAEKRDALARWGAHIEALATGAGSNIIPLRGLASAPA